FAGAPTPPWVEGLSWRLERADGGRVAADACQYRTDHRGQFRMPPLEPGDYVVRLEPAAADPARPPLGGVRGPPLEDAVAIQRRTLEALVAEWRGQGVAVEDQPPRRLTDEVLRRLPGPDVLAASTAADQVFLLESAGIAVHDWLVDQARAAARPG